MVNLESLMNLVESGQGNNYDYATDMYPSLSLSEAVAMVPSIAIRAQQDLIESTYEVQSEMINSMVESAGMMNESEIALMNESALTKVKDGITTFFGKIRTAITTIIKKIREKISEIVGNAKILFGKRAKFDEAKLRELTFNGYDFTEGDKLAAATDKAVTGDAMMKAIDGVIDVPVNDVIKSMEDKEAASDMKAKLDSLQAQSHEDRRDAFVFAITGEKYTGSDWATTMLKNYMGEKSDIKYGEGMFTVKNCQDVISSAKDLKAIEKAYNQLLGTIRKNEKTLTSIVDKMDRAASKDPSSVGSVAVSYGKEYVSLYQMAFSVLSSAMAVRTKYGNSKIQQARAMYLAMLKANKTTAEEKKD